MTDDDHKRNGPRVSVPPPPARPWSRPPAPRDDTATTEWASAQPEVADALKTTEHRVATAEPVTERLDPNEIASARPRPPKSIAPPPNASDDLATVKMDSPPDFGAEFGAPARKQSRNVTIIAAVAIAAVAAIALAVALVHGR